MAAAAAAAAILSPPSTHRHLLLPSAATSLPFSLLHPRRFTCTMLDAAAAAPFRRNSTKIRRRTHSAAAAAARTTSELRRRRPPVYPFTAIIGQEEMKLCLLLNLIDPKIGGAMIMGDRGTGKSTAVRSLSDLLPSILFVSGDPDDHPGSPAMIDLPLGATEDMVCGSIDLDRALAACEKSFRPGILARADRGILYVDEANLLDDYLVDLLLDAAASGWNTVEREGVSVTHPARFVLIGSGNPEEGEIRPQLLDRFGMFAAAATARDAETRVRVVEERARFDEDPVGFRESYRAEQEELRRRIAAGRSGLGRVRVDRETKVRISRVCAELGVDGLRGDIVTNRAAAAAAMDGRVAVTAADVAAVVKCCLRHRLRRDPMEDVDSGEVVMEKLRDVFGL